MGLEEGSRVGEGKKKKAFQRRWCYKDLGGCEGVEGVENAGKKEKKNKIKLRTLLISERESCLKSVCLSALAAA